MKVSELIRQLQNIQDKSKEVLFITGLSDARKLPYKVLTVLDIPSPYVMIDMDGHQ